MAVAGIEAALQGASGLSQARPGMLPTPIAEIAFILVCSTGQFFFSSLIGNVTITQVILVDRFNMANSQAPWLNGAYLLANGLSVTLSGAIADISGARTLIIAALAWLSAWCIVGAIVGLRNPIIFLLVRAMQGLAVGALTSSSISYLGRVYKPGMRKNRVFSVMSSLAPFGFVIGGIQGGALSNRLEWIFGSNAVLAFVAFVAAAKYAPKEQTMRAFENLTTSTTITTAAPGGKRRFDYIGATLAIISCGLLIFGLTQGSSAHWSPYTYASVIAGLAMLAVFVYAESKVAQPLVPNSLWRIKGFLPLSLSYFLSFGCFTAYQFYAVQFWLRVQKVTPLTASLYLLPNAFVGVLATFLVARLFHVVPGHIILGAGAFACALGPAFFLPQRPDTPYWVLSMPGIALSTFAPDLSFAAASIFITSNVSRRYQGVAGSMLITLQNLSSAILTSLSETVAASVGDPSLTISMLHAAWWFDLAGGVVALLVAIFALRIPKAEEKEHLQ
ncbi:MFS general substrate transporter [Tilletiaria anomala UBC 951]|uniref:MFS general substrate transporter n=1 Tax=Tilletiaria anomala (strain ATCC 24038 / CBS 436.72 / UBC 951) TaxID=1037660 RepID=A0A066VWK7_TILAU|nr:MFS general substrate transporter [Tilletiaria anomala UBC 951]KDN46122.1 MFS general substrate transporter [Tilletiaria anomala UBC 951]